MAQSGWIFEYTSDIRIVMGGIEGKRIARTTSQSSNLLRDYMPYHKKWRGSESVINFNYLNVNFRLMKDVCGDLVLKNPCLIYCLKIYFILHNIDIVDRENIIKDLNKQVFRSYDRRSTDVIRETPVSCPTDIFNRRLLH